MLGWQTCIEILEKHLAAEIHTGMPAAQQGVEADRQHAVGNHLLGSRTGSSSVELGFRGAGSVQEFVGPDLAVAVENRLTCDKHFHVLHIGKSALRLQSFLTL